MKFYGTNGKIIAGFVFAWFIIGIFSLITYRNMCYTAADTEQVATSLKILKSVEISYVSAQQIKARFNSYLINGDEVELKGLKSEVDSCMTMFNSLVFVSERDPLRLNDALELRKIVMAKISYWKKAIEIRRVKGINSALLYQYGVNGENLNERMLFLVHRIETRERDLLVKENTQQTERSQKTLILFIALALLVFVFLQISFLLIRRDSIKVSAANERIKYLADLIDQTSDAVVSVDKNRIIKSWNKGAVKMYGYTEQEAIGKTTVELLKSTVDVNKLSEFMSQDKSGEYWETEVVHQRKDKTKIYVLSSVGLVKDSSGKVIGVVGVNKDITAQKQMQNELKRFNEELSIKVAEKTNEIENIFLRITEGFVAIDINHAFTYVNDNACYLFKSERADLISKKVEEVFPEITDMEVYLGSINALENQQSKQIDFFSPLLQKWIQCNIYPSPQGLSIFIRDITEEHINREALKASEEKYRLLVEEASDAIFISDQAGNYIDVNPKACELLGYSRSELLAMNSREVLHHQQEIKKNRLSSNSLQQSGESFINERKLIKKDGATIDVETNGKILPDGRYMGIVRDITERKKTEKALRDSELRYRSLVEQASDSIILYDQTGNIIDFNSGASKMLGYSIDEIRSLNVIDLFFIEDIKKTPLRFKEQLEGATVLSERNMKRKDGTAVPVEINSRMLTDGLFLGIGRDITVRKQTEQEMQQINIRLRDLSAHLQTVREEERTNISREIHDELGQQLTALKMDASWLHKKLNGDNGLKAKALDMISLIDDTVKTIRRISADLRPVVLDDIGLVAALEWYCNEFEKRTSINCSFQSDFSELNFSKETAICIFRICQETLTNVARHSQATQVQIKATKNDDSLLLSIIDNGIGFDTNRLKEKKTLGLLGMQERAMMCNGTFKIESHSKGTSITLKIPLENELDSQIAS